MNAFVDDLLKPHEKFDITKLDLLKINSIEILMNLIQFAPQANVRSFTIGEGQKKNDHPFLRQVA